MIYCLFFNKGEACSCCSSCADVEGGGCFSGCAGRCCCMAKKTLSSKDANAESVEVQGSASVAASVPGVASQKNYNYYHHIVHRHTARYHHYYVVHCVAACCISIWQRNSRISSEYPQCRTHHDCIDYVIKEKWWRW